MDGKGRAVGLLSDLLTRPFKRPVKDMLVQVPDRRGSERFATTLPVSLSKSDLPPFAASLINISTTGAAITNAFGRKQGMLGNV